MSSTPVTVPELTLVTSPACHLCDDARTALHELAADRQVRLRIIDIESSEGLALVARHRPAMNPLVLLDGEFFSSGRLPRGKLRKRLSRSEGAFR